MIGTISFIREKDGTRGKYLTLALEDGTKGLVVNDEKIMEAVKEGETYNFTVEKSGVYTIVTGIMLACEEDIPEKPLAPDGQKTKPQYKVSQPTASSYKSEYMKKRTPAETAIIAKQAFAKALIEGYARLWTISRDMFEDFDEFNDKIRVDADAYVDWLEIKKEEK